MQVNLRSFRAKVKRRKAAYRRFLSRLERTAPRNLDNHIAFLEKKVWDEVDCISCANCCKTMSPTYTESDIKRIANHFKVSVSAFKTKWLRKDKSGDWINRSVPCQFLDLKTNKCTVYEVRPRDCSGFPHLPKRKMVDYMHVHKQNLEFCPATFRMVEKLRDTIQNTRPAQK